MDKIIKIMVCGVIVIEVILFNLLLQAYKKMEKKSMKPTFTLFNIDFYIARRNNDFFEYTIESYYHEILWQAYDNEKIIHIPFFTIFIVWNNDVKKYVNDLKNYIKGV